jgi:hypothetical protein
VLAVGSCAGIGKLLEFKDDRDCISVESRSWTAVKYCVIHRYVRTV